MLIKGGDGWSTEVTGDWGGEESWESVDGGQGGLTFPFYI